MEQKKHAAPDYVEIMRPLIEAMVKIAPDLSAHEEANRPGPDEWEKWDREIALGLDPVSRHQEQEEDIARLLDRLGREAGLEISSLAEAVGVVGDTLSIAEVKLRDRGPGDPPVRVVHPA